MSVVPLQDQLFGDLRPLMLTLMAATALLLLLTIVIQGMLFQIKPAEPLTHLTVSLVLALVVLVACAVPAWRAATIDPTQALRCEQRPVSLNTEW